MSGNHMRVRVFGFILRVRRGFPEFRDVLTAADALQTGATVPSSSIYDVTELILPILESPLRHMFPSVSEYAKSCDDMLTRVTNTLHIFTVLAGHLDWDAFSARHGFSDGANGIDSSIIWLNIINWRDADSVDDGPRLNFNARNSVVFEPSFATLPDRMNSAQVGIVGREHSTGNFSKETVHTRNLNFATTLPSLWQKLTSRMDCRLEHVYNADLSDIRLRVYVNCVFL